MDLPRRVLVTDYVDHSLISGLEGSGGYHVVYAPEMKLPLVREVLPAFSGLVVNTRIPVDAAMMRSAPSLRFIGRLGVGLDIFDMDEARSSGIRIYNTPGANANAVAEHCFGLLLALLRKIPSAHAEVRKGLWRREKNRGREIAGLTIGIIGFGNTGRAFAEKFAGWQTQVVSYDKYKERYAEDLRFVVESDFETVLIEADILSLHVPLTEETSGMINSEVLNRCKKGIILINSSRGKVVRTADLLNALKAEHVSGACLDVLDNEDVGSYTEREKALYQELTSRDDVIISPHIAGWTHRSKRQIARQMLDQILSDQ